MSDAKPDTPTALWHAQVLKVEEDRPRLRLPKQLAAAISWLASVKEDLSCVATVGVRGGIQVYPLSMIASHSGLLRRLSTKQLRRNAAGSEVVEYIRYSAMSWRLMISVESSRYALYLPEEARKLSMAPNSGELAVAFAAGEIFEVWKATEWVAYLRRVGGNMGQLEQAILQDLQSGESQED